MMKKFMFSVMVSLLLVAGGSTLDVASDEYQPGPFGDPEGPLV
ncbi:hypothetical protein [Shouchella miscanthi]|uniref:Uncharacterized protein n=1 Tax=Shouchella miscanthi TaxID=2598861 RepID=A0ABU6NLN9_9BACI|nr:hypothetical protein [Shouchella miscanthi]